MLCVSGNGHCSLPIVEVDAYRLLICPSYQRKELMLTKSEKLACCTSKNKLQCIATWMVKAVVAPHNGRKGPTFSDAQAIQ